MKGIEKVFTGNKLVAIIYRKDIIVAEGVKFLTSQQNYFQVGIHQRQKSTHLSPHIHKIEKPFVIDSIQEILYVIKGKIRVSLYSSKGRLIKAKILRDGDSILLLKEGHGVDFLDDSRIFEVKQGPYPGVTHSKIYLNK